MDLLSNVLRILRLLFQFVFIHKQRFTVNSREGRSDPGGGFKPLALCEAMNKKYTVNNEKRHTLITHLQF